MGRHINMRMKRKIYENRTEELQGRRKKQNGGHPDTLEWVRRHERAGRVRVKQDKIGCPWRRGRGVGGKRSRRGLSI